MRTFGLRQQQLLEERDFDICSSTDIAVGDDKRQIRLARRVDYQISVRKVVVARKAVGRNDRRQPGSYSCAQAVLRIFQRYDALAQDLQLGKYGVVNRR